jgi:hypothetical protein
MMANTGMYPQQYGMNGAFSMNPSAATFGPAGMGGMMYMPGGGSYFAPNFPQVRTGSVFCTWRCHCCCCLHSMRVASVVHPYSQPTVPPGWTGVKPKLLLLLMV